MGNLFAAFIIEFLFSKNSRSIFIKGIVLLLIGSILIKGFNLFIDYFPCFMVVILFFCVVYSLLRIIVIILNTHFVKQVKIDSFFSIKAVCKIFIGLFLIFLFSSYFLNAIEDSKQAYDKFYSPKAAEYYESEIYDEEKLRIFIVPALHMNFIETGLILVNYGISDAICKAYNI